MGVSVDQWRKERRLRLMREKHKCTFIEHVPEKITL